MKRIKIKNGSARVSDNVSQKTINVINVASELAYDMIIEEETNKQLKNQFKGSEIAKKHLWGLSNFKIYVTQFLKTTNDEDKWTFDYESYLHYLADLKDEDLVHPLNFAEEYYQDRWNVEKVKLSLNSLKKIAHKKVVLNHVEFYSMQELPELSKDDKSFSVTVMVYDKTTKNEVYSELGYYCYDDAEWVHFGDASMDLICWCYVPNPFEFINNNNLTTIKHRGYRE